MPDQDSYLQELYKMTLQVHTTRTWVNTQIIPHILTSLATFVLKPKVYLWVRHQLSEFWTDSCLLFLLNSSPWLHLKIAALQWKGWRCKKVNTYVLDKIQHIQSEPIIWVLYLFAELWKQTISISSVYVQSWYKYITNSAASVHTALWVLQSTYILVYVM